MVCADSPLSTEVTVLNLTEPLVRQKEEPDPGVDPDQGMSQSAAADTIEAWDLPWTMELANGDQCSLLRGTLTVMAGQVVHYECVNGGMVLGGDGSKPASVESNLRWRRGCRLQSGGGGGRLVIAGSGTDQAPGPHLRHR
jgi:hypothetical protein